MYTIYMEVSSGARAKWVPTYNKRGRRLGLFLLWGGLDKSPNKINTTLFVRLQRGMKGLYNAVEGKTQDL